MWILTNVIMFIATLAGSFSFIYHSNFTYIFKGVGYFGYSIFLESGGLRGFRLLSSSPNENMVKACTLSGCEKYFDFPNSTKAFFGAAITGKGLVNTSTVVCNPQYADEKYRTQGICYFQQKDKFVPYAPFSDIRKQVIRYNKTYEYLYTHGQLGFSAKYVENDGYLLGAPSVLAWKGTIVKYTFDEVGDAVLNSERKVESNSYLGYAIEYGQFNYRSRKTAFVIAGAPRGGNLLGEVLIFRYDDFPDHLVTVCNGQQIGSYFGASLLAIGDFLLIGAPMQTTKNYEEGCVFVYVLTSDSLVLLQRIYSHKVGGRFGFAMSKLGSINADLTDAVVISAPYEDQNSGTVYIYATVENGYKEIQKITGRSVLDSIRGFGFSLSNAIDIDKNGYKDFAVGAYLSGNVVIFRSRPILRFEGNIASNVSKIQDYVNHIGLTYCFQYKSLSNSETINLEYQVIADDRVTISAYDKKIDVQVGKLYCQTIVLTLRSHAHDNPYPLKIKIQSKLTDGPNNPVIYPNITTVEHQIPSATGCGEDSICTPLLKMSAGFELSPANSTVFIIGSQQVLTFTVELENFGETAYLTKLNMSLEEELSKIPAACSKHEAKLTCDVSNRFTNQQKKIFRFAIDVDTTHLNFEKGLIKIDLIAFSAGEGPGTMVNLTVALPLLSQLHTRWQTFFLEYVVYNKEKATVSFFHEYKLINEGPSPYINNFTVQVPYKVSNPNGEFVKIADIQQVDEDCIEEQTLLSKEKRNTKNLVSHSIPGKGRISLDCQNPLVRCKNFICSHRIYANDSRSYIFNMVVSVKAIVEAYKEAGGKDVIIIESVAKSSMHEPVKIYTVLYKPVENESVPVWVWIISAVLAVVILALITYGLHKANFFSRPMRERLISEEEASQGIMECASDEGTSDDREESL